MGLTIYYNLRSNAKSADKAKKLVEQMRQLALDLPFEQVDDHVRYIGQDICQRPLDELRGNESDFSAVLDATEYVACPWGKKRGLSVGCQLLEVISFLANPGPGSESIRIGLARYPAEIEVPYRPQDDDKFTRTVNEGRSTHWEFDWRNWKRFLGKQDDSWFYLPSDEKFRQQRKIKTRLSSGWHFSACCKTQYASDPSCGGIPNFLKCHISIISLLDRIAKLPTMQVEVNDEGKYGPAKYSDDWREARTEGREPTYARHDGKYSVRALAEEVGQWNEMIAGMFGRLSDAINASGSSFKLEGPITEFANFEHLEFKGQQNQEQLKPFLVVADQLANQLRAESSRDDD